MTREEAIERFENVKANALAQKASGVSEYWQNEIDGTIEALDMAIEALSAEPSDDIEGDIDFHIDLKHNRMTVFNDTTESLNDAVENNDEVIETVRCKDCKWYKNCEYFDPHNAPCRLTHEIHTETHECVKETHDSDLISREDLLKKAEKGNITKYSTNSVNIITTDVVTVENIKKAPSADTPTTEVKKPTNTPTDLISRADALEQMAQAACGLHYEDCEADNCSCSYIGRILDLPSVSAERVIRCKDCEYRDKTKVNKKGFEVCVASGMDITDNDFCSLAKMKGGTENG